MESAHSPWLVVPSHPQSQPWLVKSFSLCVTESPTLLPLSSMFKDPVITLGPFSSFRIIFIFQGLLIRNLNATCKLYFPFLCSITYAKVPQLTAWTSLGGSHYSACHSGDNKYSTHALPSDSWSQTVHQGVADSSLCSASHYLWEQNTLSSCVYASVPSPTARVAL